jgi:hypothetical protein
MAKFLTKRNDNKKSKNRLAKEVEIVIKFKKLKPHKVKRKFKSLKWKRNYFDLLKVSDYRDQISTLSIFTSRMFCNSCMYMFRCFLRIQQTSIGIEIIETKLKTMIKKTIKPSVISG